jgi:hypothetical protein
MAHANGILFFEEEDALFGKRSDVHASHDRYANIEIGYLHQKREHCHGRANLATNLSWHLDDAFAQRRSSGCTSHSPTQRFASESGACLTVGIQVRWIQNDRAVDASPASASASIIPPPPAATPVRQNEEPHNTVPNQPSGSMPATSRAMAG